MQATAHGTRPVLLLSRRVIDEFADPLNAIAASSPNGIDLQPFTLGVEVSGQRAGELVAAYYSRDIWEGSERTALSAAAQAFWNIIDSAPHLQWMHVYSSGADQARYQQIMRQGVRLTTSAGAQSESVGIAAVSGLLALARRLPRYFAAQQRAQWAPLRNTDMPPDLGGQHALIIGAGRIGSVIARVLHSCGMRVTGIRQRSGPAEHFDRIVPPSSLDDEIPGCDWLILACPLTGATRGLIDARRLALLRPGAGFVNIARGELVEEAALIEALASRHVGCAYLDVFAVEPLSPTSTLWALDNVLISPHNAGASAGTYARGVEGFLRNLRHFLHAEALENQALAEG
jgi:phosphoglycerate dehydrogenase-like enzyme